MSKPKGPKKAVGLIGQTLQNRYYISHQIGEGGMGRVYYGKAIRLGHPVAIKETLSSNSNESSQQIAARVRAFQREANLLAGTIKHDAIPRVIDYFQIEHNWYIVMDYVGGENLEQQMRERTRPYTIKEVIPWMDQLLAILDALHNGTPQIIHRDIKPSNIKINEGKVYLLDFGLAKPVTGTKSSIALFTPAYAPPEQLENTNPSEQLDIYSVGATMYYLLTKTEPASAFSRTLGIASGNADPLQPVAELNSDIPPAFAQLIMNMMSIRPDDRPSSAKDVRVRMAHVLNEDRGQKTMSSHEFLRSDHVPPIGFGLSTPVKELAPEQVSNAAREAESRIRSVALTGRGIRRGTVIAVVGGLLAVAILGGVLIRKQWVNRQRAIAESARHLAIQKTDQAMEMLYINDYDKAKALSKEAMDHDPTYALAQAINGDAFWDEVLSEDEETDSSANPVSQIRKGAILQIFSGKEPSTTEDFAARAWAFLANKNWEKARVDIDTVMGKKPDWAWALMQKGFVVIGRNCFDEKGSKDLGDTISNLTRVTALKPKYATAHMNLAHAYACNKQDQEVFDSIARAIRLRPRSVFYTNRGDYYLDTITDKMDKASKERHIERADEDYQAALQKEPQFSLAHVGRAKVFIAKEDYQRCLEELEKALLLRPTYSAYLHRSVCRASWATKNKDAKGFDDALADLDKAQELASKFNDSRNRQSALANVYYQRAQIQFNYKATYLLSEKYLKNRTIANRDAVAKQLELARASAELAIQSTHDKDQAESCTNLKKQIEQSIRLFKKRFG